MEFYPARVQLRGLEAQLDEAISQTTKLLAQLDGYDPLSHDELMDVAQTYSSIVKRALSRIEPLLVKDHAEFTDPTGRWTGKRGVVAYIAQHPTAVPPYDVYSIVDTTGRIHSGPRHAFSKIDPCWPLD